MIGLPTFKLPPKDVVYLLHFSEPYKGATHYLGWTCRFGFRMREHRAGRGAALTRAAVEAGISFEVARLWWGYNRHDEKRLRSMKCNPKLCPFCNPQAHHRTNGHLTKDIPF